MNRNYEHFEIRSIDDQHGLCGTFDTAAEALAEINRSYVHAKEQGYDNKHEKWIIVCNQVAEIFSDDGEFFKEEKVRFVVESVRYSDYENAFVFVY